MPMLGCGYLITMVGPDKDTTPLGHAAFQLGRSVVLSTQGLVVSLPYCYLNTEVRDFFLLAKVKFQFLYDSMDRNII